MSEHVHEDGEALLELVLSRAPRPAGVLGCAVCRAELALLEDVVLRARRALDARELVPAVDARRVAERVLAATTREDLGLDGDLALVTSFVRSRLAASPWLRLLAASLLIHLLALPVLAWLGLAQRQRADVPTFRFEPPAESTAWEDDVRSELPPLDAVTPLDEVPPAVPGRAPGAPHDDTLRIARFLAARGAPELPPLRADEGELERLLRLRAETIDAYAKRTRAGAAAPLPPASSWLARVLHAELLLDRHALGAPPDARELAQALAVLDPRAARPTAALEALALARAESYGVFVDDGRLVAARAAFEPGLGGLLASGPDGVRRVGPLDGRWTALFAAALEPDQQRAPVVAAWLAAGG